MVPDKNIASSRGNVLFLILIAVALFAALSYAVTSSTRSGGGNADKEATSVGIGWLQSHGSALATTITRMRASQGIALTDLCFFAPSNSLYSNTSYQARNPFHPQGGGATYATAPPSVSWSFSPYFTIALADLPNVGSSGSLASTEVVMVVGVNKATCDAVNKRNNAPLYEGIFIPSITPTSATYPGACISNLSTYSTFTPASYPALSGAQEGCVDDIIAPSSNIYYYYRVLVER